MKTSQNTILITGGGSGIGFEMAKLFSQQGNQVILTGRTEQKLQKATSEIPNSSYIVADVTDEASVAALVSTIEQEYPSLNVLINNAGAASYYSLTSPAVNAYSKAKDEIETNYLSIIRLTEALLPLLQSQTQSAIVNVSSVVSFAPAKAIPTYSASKAALHSYTYLLREELKNSSVKVFEIMPPLVNTDFAKEIGGENGIPPLEVAEALAEGLTNDQFEIRVAVTAQLYQLFLQSPDTAFKALNAIE